MKSNNLLKNKSFYLINLMILISILIFFLSNFIQIWLCMEINTMLMIMLMSIINKNSKTSMNYFIIKSISGLILIMMILMKNLFNSLIIDIFILSMIFMKLNLFPFFFWMPYINSNINWIMIFFMSTTQKIAPLIFLNILFNQMQMNLLYIYLINLMAIFSSMISTIMSINELNMKKIMTYSSINHSSWMIIIISIDFYMFSMYFFLYMISMMFICLILNKFEINKFNELSKLLMFKKNEIIIPLMINLMIIMALPPFFSFLIKLNSLKMILINYNHFTSMMFLILSVFTLIFYMNILIKIKIIYLLKNKFYFNLKFKMNFWLILLISLISLSTLFFMYINM